MAQVILDFGSGNTCCNNIDYAKRMIDELKAIDTGKHKVTIKWQLFKEAGENIPLDKHVFMQAYNYGEKLGYHATASVFDKESLDFLLHFGLPFIKIANNRELDWLIGEVPRNIPVYVSRGFSSKNIATNETLKMLKLTIEDKLLCCVSEYPAQAIKYKENFTFNCLKFGISDHTTNFELWHEYKPAVIEWHYVLEHDENNLDGGLFARTPEQLREIL